MAKKTTPFSSGSLNPGFPQERAWCLHFESPANEQWISSPVIIRAHVSETHRVGLRDRWFCIEWIKLSPGAASPKLTMEGASASILSEAPEFFRALSELAKSNQTFSPEEFERLAQSFDIYPFGAIEPDSSDPFQVFNDARSRAISLALLREKAALGATLPPGRRARKKSSL